MQRRILRINELLREELSVLIRTAKDPRLQGLVSVIAVETSPDLQQARVYVSMLGSQEERHQLLEGLRAARSFLRRELISRLDLRKVPELAFIQDDSIERGARVLSLLQGEAAPNEEQGQRQ